MHKIIYFFSRRKKNQKNQENRFFFLFPLPAGFDALRVVLFQSIH